MKTWRVVAVGLTLLAAGCARSAQTNLPGLALQPTPAPTPVAGRSVTSGGSSFAFTDIPPLGEQDARPAAPPSATATTAPPPRVAFPDAGKVELSGNAFAPNAIVVTSGTAVTWVQRDGAVHTVTSRDGIFASGNLARSETFTVRFTTPGTYVYYCELHPYMLGSVTVE